MYLLVIEYKGTEKEIKKGSISIFVMDKWDILDFLLPYIS